MRIFITGATGFVGSYVTEMLLEQGHDIAILKRAKSDTWRITHIKDMVTHIQGDLTHIGESAKEIERFHPDAMIHLAWHGVTKTHRQEITQIDNNLYGSLQLGQLALDIGCEVFIGTGSQAEYGIKSSIIDENATPEPISMYGSAKLATYFLLRQLFSDSQTRFVWFRLFSSYGPKDNASYLIPMVIKSLTRGVCPPLTMGEQKWDYIYVNDVAEAIYQSMLNSSVDGLFNLGSGKVHSIRYIVELIRDTINPNLELQFGNLSYDINQIMYLQANMKKFNHQSGWSSETSLATGIKQTVAYFRKQPK